MVFSAALQQRQLVLSRAGQVLLSLPLDRGGSYRVVAPDLAAIDAAMAALECVPGVSVLPASGGLLGAMTVSANLSLALCHGQEVDAATLREWESRLELALDLCGVSAQRLRTLGRELPMHMDPMERWLVGLVVRVMRPAELLVLDRAFAGLSRRQAGSVMALVSVYQEFHPFRPVLFVDLDTHGLPAIDGCRETVEIEGVACPS